MLRNIVPFVIGLVVSLAVHQATGWWLNSSLGVRSMLLVLAAASMLMAWLMGDSSPRPVVSLWAGSFLGMIAILIWTGGGTIWPIVLVAAGLLSACAVAVGAVAGRALGSARTTRR